MSNDISLSDFDFNLGTTHRKNKGLPVLTLVRGGKQLIINRTAYTHLGSPTYIQVGIDFKNRKILIIPSLSLDLKNLLPINLRTCGQCTIPINKYAKDKLNSMGLKSCEGELIDGKLLFNF